MTTSYDLDPRLADWLADAPATPLLLVDRILDTTTGVAQRRARRIGPLIWPVGPSSVRLVGLAAAVVVAVLLAFLVGQWLPDPHRTVAPNDTPQPNGSDARAYRSAQFFYTVATPRNWSFRPATQDWGVTRVFRGQRGESAAFVDVYEEAGTPRFWVMATPAVNDQDLETFVTTFVA